MPHAIMGPEILFFVCSRPDDLAHSQEECHRVYLPESVSNFIGINEKTLHYFAIFWCNIYYPFSIVVSEHNSKKCGFELLKISLFVFSNCLPSSLKSLMIEPEIRAG